MYKMKCSFTQFLLYARQTTLANRKQDVAGYAYTSFRNSKGADNGQMLHETFTFTKKENRTLLLSRYSASIRVIASSAGGGVSPAGWYFQIDGFDCTQEGDTDVYLYESNTSSYSYSPAVLTGTCSAICAGILLAGIDVITGHVKLGPTAVTV